MLIILRAGTYNTEDYRLVLFTSEFERIAQNRRINVLKVKLEDSVIESLDALTTYVNHGSICSTRVVSPWIIRNNYQEKLLLFKLSISDDGAEHLYEFIGVQDDITRLFEESESRRR